MASKVAHKYGYSAQKLAAIVHGVAFGCCVGWCLTGCVPPDAPVVGKQYTSVAAKNLETERAMEQLRQADVTIDYESEKRLLLAVAPPDGKYGTVNIAGLEGAVVLATTNRELVVITMGPRDEDAAKG